MSKDISTREVAQLFIEHGDVTVVKTAACLYWVDFESFDSTEAQGKQCVGQVQGTLNRIIQSIRRSHRALIRNVREYREAHRFPTTILRTSQRPKFGSECIGAAAEIKRAR